MVSRKDYKIISIHITTYKKEGLQKRTRQKMSNHSNYEDKRNDQNAKFICSICLNSKAKEEDERITKCGQRKSKSCPICHKNSDIIENSCNKYHYSNGIKHDKVSQMHSDNTKNVQTSRSDIAQGISLLNEVLTVFQGKKQIERGKPKLVKDASISTEAIRYLKPKLATSEIFQYSIEETNLKETGKFSIINFCQPEIVHNSQCSIDLIKHKSSSIPQMKMEELKNSLNKKNKTSKDAIKEVNRMFATLNRNDSRDENNRPKIRYGPRILPVVKTSALENLIQKQSERNSSVRSDKQPTCKCCQTSNYFLSGGDYVGKQQCCYSKCDKETCEKSVYTMSCRYKTKRDYQTDVLICERCRKSHIVNSEDE